MAGSQVVLCGVLIYAQGSEKSVDIIKLLQPCDVLKQVNFAYQL